MRIALGVGTILRLVASLVLLVSSLLVAPLVLIAPLAASDCLPIADAKQHVGENKCVTGKVLRVKVGAKGVHYIDFCEDQMACPFTVVVWPFTSVP